MPLLVSANEKYALSTQKHFPNLNFSACSFVSILPGNQWHHMSGWNTFSTILFMPLKLHILIASENILVLEIVSLIDPGFAWQSLHQRRRFKIKLLVSWEVNATPFKCLAAFAQTMLGQMRSEKRHGKDWTRLPVLFFPLCHWSRWFVSRVLLFSNMVSGKRQHLGDEVGLRSCSSLS